MSLIHFSKVSALTLLTISIVACSSGGNHTKISPITPPLSEQDAADKAAADKAAADKAAADKAAAEKAAAEKAAAEKAAAEKAAAEKAAAEKAAAEKVAAEKAAAEKAAAAKAAADKAAAAKAAAAKAAAEKAAAEKAAAEKAAAEKAAAEKAAAEKAAADKAAADKAAAEKAAAEKAAAEKAAAEKAAAEKAAAEKAEKERLQKIEANRLVLLDKAKKAGLSAAQAAAYAEANKQATDKVAQTALETLVADKAAADKAAADKAAAEKVEKERLQKIEANRLALNKKAKDAGLSAEQAAAYAEANKEAQAKTAQEALNSIVAENTRIATKKSELVVKAQVAGLNADRAKKFADNNVDTADTNIAKALNAEVSKAVIADKGGVYEKGLTTDNKITSQSSSSQYIQTPYGSRYVTQTKTESSLNKTYDQPYSVVVGSGTMTTTTDNYNGTQTTNNFGIEKVAGLATLEQNVPSIGRAAYTGQAFSSIDKNGDFNYLVDFDKRKGSGEITGWQEEFGDVKLKEGSLKKVNVGGKTVVGVSGTWSGNTDGLHVAETSESQGSYTLGLFGPKAEEVAGTATVNSVLTAMHTGIQAGNSYVVGFGGQKDAKALLKRQAIEAGLTEKRAQVYAETNVNKATADEALKAAVKTQADDLAKLAAMGTAVGLTDVHAKIVATAQLDAPKSELKKALQNAALTQATEVKITAFGNENAQSRNGLNSKRISQDSLNDKNQYSLREGWNYIYQQPYSMVVGTWLLTDIKDDVNQLTSGSSYNVDVAGFSTQAAALPNVGKATYNGLSVRINDKLDLTYNVDFGKRTGSGYLLKATDYGGKISLDEGKIAQINLKGNKVMGISSSATALNGTLGKYDLGFFGTEAQEIAGSLEMDSGSFAKNVNGKTEIGFGGTRGEISKK